MTRLGFIFPGQGAQHTGMGKELYDEFAEARNVFDLADRCLGYKLGSLCFEGPQETLNQTYYAQPAILTASIAAYRVILHEGINPVILAGLSLGEYTALTAAGAVALEEVLPLVQTRARLMQEAVPLGKGAMAAVFNMDNQTIKEVVDQQQGIVDISNYNCPGQVVISGEKEAVDGAARTLKAAGARVVPLAVSVPSHCILMKEAAERLRPILDQINWQEPEIEVVSNVNARENKASEFPDLLMKQLYCPVLWEQSFRYMMEKADYFIEIGPGSTLTGLVKKIDKSRIIGQVNDLKTLEKTLEKVKSI
jgi:[acyl-carrier-protein] S-malonyltransferase